MLGFMKGYFRVPLLWAVGNDKQTGQQGSLAMVENEHKYYMKMVTVVVVQVARAFDLQGVLFPISC